MAIGTREPHADPCVHFFRARHLSTPEIMSWFWHPAALYATTKPLLYQACWCSVRNLGMPPEKKKKRTFLVLSFIRESPGSLPHSLLSTSKQGGNRLHLSFELGRHCRHRGLFVCGLLLHDRRAFLPAANRVPRPAVFLFLKRSVEPSRTPPWVSQKRTGNEPLYCRTRGV